MEKISVDKLTDIVETIKDGQLTNMRPKVTAGFTSTIDISICGASWQEMQNQRRIKAIPYAALFRLRLDGKVRSLATFKIEKQQVSELDSIEPTNALSGGVHQYYNITIRQFINQLRTANMQLSEEMKNKVPLNADNFTSPFTNSERSALSRFSTSFG